MTCGQTPWTACASSATGLSKPRTLTTALRILDADGSIRLLFTDVGLPGGMNGRQLADDARRRRPELKVLFTTGYARNAIVHHGRLDPGVELIVKPYSYRRPGGEDTAGAGRLSKGGPSLLCSRPGSLGRAR